MAWPLRQKLAAAPSRVSPRDCTGADKSSKYNGDYTSEAPMLQPRPSRLWRQIHTHTMLRTGRPGFSHRTTIWTRSRHGGSSRSTSVVLLDGAISDGRAPTTAS